MKAVVILLLALSINSSQAVAVSGVEPKDELLSLLDGISLERTDANSLAPVADLAQMPQQPTVFNAEPNEPVASQPPVISAEPNIPAKQEMSPVDASLEESRQLRRSFFRDKIEAVETMSAEQQEKNLDQLISQLNALVPPEKSAADKAELSEPNAAPMEPAVEAPDPAIQQAPAEEVQPEAKTVADPNLTIDPLLVKLEKVEEIVDPLLLADTLFRKGYHPKAYEYYQQAAERIPAEDIENTQWALFQLANSCARTDPAQAIKHYTELLTRFPNSPWSGSALSQKTTLEWTMNETLNKYVSGR